MADYCDNWDDDWDDSQIDSDADWGDDWPAYWSGTLAQLNASEGDVFHMVPRYERKEWWERDLGGVAA